MRGCPSRFAVAAVLGLLIGGCSSGPTQAVPPPVAPEHAVPPAALVKAGIPKRNYANACADCHDGDGFAVRVLADRLGPEKSLIHKSNDLDPDTIRAVVRGGMGAMPAMSKIEVSDAELDGIIAYLGKARVGAAGSGQ